MLQTGVICQHDSDMSDRRIFMYIRNSCCCHASVTNTDTAIQSCIFLAVHISHPICTSIFGFLGFGGPGPIPAVSPLSELGSLAALGGAFAISPHPIARVTVLQDPNCKVVVNCNN